MRELQTACCLQHGLRPSPLEAPAAPPLLLLLALQWLLSNWTRPGVVRYHLTIIGSRGCHSELFWSFALYRCCRCRASAALLSRQSGTLLLSHLSLS